MLTQAELQAQIHYDPETGLFTWIKTNNKAGYYPENKYSQIGLNNKLYYGHRLAWLYVYGYFPQYVDHINGVKSDNRLINLRKATNQQNACNSKIPVTNTSRIKGVMWNKNAKKWQVQITLNQKKYHIGYFADFFEACCIVFVTRNKLHGDYANNG
jgi:hypothetical protein